MLGYALTFAILALLAGILGFVALGWYSRDDRQGLAVRVPGPFRDLPDLWQEVGAGCLIFMASTSREIQAGFRKHAGREPWPRDRMTLKRSSIAWR